MFFLFLWINYSCLTLQEIMRHHERFDSAFLMQMTPAMARHGKIDERSL